MLCDKYELVRELGSGGMGTVWVAHHVQLDIPVAIKLLHPNLDEPTLASRFVNEARVLARLEHPAIVRVLDFGQTVHGEPLLAMELLRGESLAEVLDRDGSLGPVGSVRMLLPIAAGLAAAHEKRIFHRDLKPDNILIASLDSGLLQPKLIDFGIARSIDEKPVSRLTRNGGVVGSPEYMAPEQAAGRDDLDHRVDVWGFCALLYECVTGQLLYPMEESSYERVLRRIIEDAPTPMRVWGIQEEELWRIIERGLQKDRETRWQSFRDLGRALSQWLCARGVTTDVTQKSLASQWGTTPEPIRLDPTRSTAGPPVERTSRASSRSLAVAAGALAGSLLAWSLQGTDRMLAPTESSATDGVAAELGAPIERSEDHAASTTVEARGQASPVSPEDTSADESTANAERAPEDSSDSTEPAPPKAAAATTPGTRPATRNQLKPWPGEAEPSSNEPRNSTEVFEHDLGF